MTSYLKQAREWASPTLKKTAFLTRGVLTPEEFVLAGDELVFKCPTWSWEGGDPSRTRNHLPPDKQFLVTRNVPCQERVAAMEGTLLGETEMEISPDDQDGDAGGDINRGEGWLVSHVAGPGDDRRRGGGGADGDGEDDEFDFVTMNEDGEGEIVSSRQFASSSTGAGGGGESSEPTQTPGNAAEEEEDDEYGDMEDFEDDNVRVDEATASASAVDADPGNDNIRRVRTYDISITYDKYYQTPRVWIYGYGEEDGSTPLTPDEMFEDVMSDYVKRTVTIETHPHVSGPHLSVHPCQHGAVMKNIVRNLTKDGGREPTVEMYMFIFLKFVSSIIPTMNYDFTTEVTASTEK